MDLVAHQDLFRRYVRTLVEASRRRKEIEPLPDDIEMDPYRGAVEKLPTPATTKSDTAHDPSDAISQPQHWQRIAKDVNATRMKIGQGEYKTDEDPGYEEFQGTEWFESDLPIQGYIAGIETHAGVSLDSRIAREKQMLAKVVPRFVLQALVTAARDYKEKLREPLDVIKRAVMQYISDLRSTRELSDAELAELSSPEGMAALAGSLDFDEFFEDWMKGDQQFPGIGTAKGANPKDAQSKWKVNRALWQSAKDIVERLGIIDLDQDEHASGDLAPMLGLETKYEPETSKIEQFLIARKSPDDKTAGDPGFRYFFGTVQATGSRNYYWSWIRRQARKAGKYPVDADWTLYGKVFGEE